MHNLSLNQRHCWRGRAIQHRPANSSLLWVIDANNHNLLAPVGSIGELFIGEPLSLRGHLNDAEKTAKAFITDLIWSRKFPNPTGITRHMYKARDLVRYQSDGTLQCIARKVVQVKARGNCVELGKVKFSVRSKVNRVAQVAVNLVQIPARRDCVLAPLVCIAENIYVDQDAELPAPMTADVETELAELSDALKISMPSHMVPGLSYCCSISR